MRRVGTRLLASSWGSFFRLSAWLFCFSFDSFSFEIGERPFTPPKEEKRIAHPLGYAHYSLGVIYDEDGDWESAHIGIKENYVDPLMNYIFHRAYGKDTDISGNKERAAEYHSLFLGAMGITKGGR